MRGVGYRHPILGEAAVGGDDESVEISENDLTPLGVGVEVGEDRGRDEITTLTDVRKRRRERPPISVGEPHRVEGGTCRVAARERDAARFVVILGNEHPAIAKQATDLVVESQHKLDRFRVRWHLREGEREPSRWWNHPGRDQDGMEHAEDAVEVEASFIEDIELVVRERYVHGPAMR